MHLAWAGLTGWFIRLAPISSRGLDVCVWRRVRSHHNNFLPFFSLPDHSSLLQMSQCPNGMHYLLSCTIVYINCSIGAAAQQTLFLQCHLPHNPALTFFFHAELILLHLANIIFFLKILPFFPLTTHVLLYVDPIHCRRPFFLKIWYFIYFRDNIFWLVPSHQ